MRLPITENGKNFYYADYTQAGGRDQEVYARSTYTCCSGTYIQAVAEYVNLIYFKDADAVVCEFVCAVGDEVGTTCGERTVKVTQATNYPEGDVSTFTVAGSGKFAMKFRVPGWASGASLKINGADANVGMQGGDMGDGGSGMGGQ